jgi:hypothetical protein
LGTKRSASLANGDRPTAKKPVGVNALLMVKGEKVSFSKAVVLTKREAFEACEVCAEAERALLRSGRAPEAGRLAALFELIESRLVSS